MKYALYRLVKHEAHTVKSAGCQSCYGALKVLKEEKLVENASDLELFYSAS